MEGNEWVKMAKQIKKEYRIYTRSSTREGRTPAFFFFFFVRVLINQSVGVLLYSSSSVPDLYAGMV